MIVLALTGSIGMGKTTVAKFFAELGVPIFNADAAVHRLYQQEDLINQLSALFPRAVENGVVNRKTLADIVFRDKGQLSALEAILHPFIRAEEARFIERNKEIGKAIVVLELPLYFERPVNKLVDKVVVVTAPFALQRQRVLSRTDMTEAKFKEILAHQLSDDEKRHRADYIIFTDKSMDDTRSQVAHVIAQCQRLVAPLKEKG